jgi:nickel/cobalt exporter
MNATLPLGWLYLPVAFALGALHALEPGHGKSLASAYLVAGEHTWKDAILLGVATTVSHTGVVLLLAGASLGLKGLLPQGSLEALVRLVGAWALLLLGGWTIFRSTQDLRHGHSHGHSHGHGHGQGPGEAETSQGAWGVVLIGLSNGVLPCPGALAALLVALSLGKVALGLTTVVTYSLGLATALAVMGILVVEAGRRARNWFPSDQAMLWLPLASGILVAGTGLWLLME